ncbi:C40 family peptidase [Dermabacter hominis]|uniref:C40 family peptidase n=1 Tax=Dermabacter hominis TaxID=36740 RepID=UPI000C782CF0|nr:NlpC/P60 family protein [Dermabacter hominis]
MEGPHVSNRLANTHRRQMRPVTPVARATRGTAGVAFAATFVLTGSTGALADGTTQADAAAESTNVVAPVTAPAVTIPVAQKHDDSAFGVFAASAATLKPKAPVVEVEEPEALNDRDEDESDNREEDSRETNETEERRSDRREERANDESEDNDNSEDTSDRKKREKKSEERDNETEEASSSSAATGSIFSTAKRGIGVRYVFGGSSPSGWDCSGFTSWVYRQHGIHLPHSAGAQARMGKRVSRSEARPGDLAYYPGHVGIYAGNGMILDAGNSAKNTSIRKLWNANWSFYRIVD